MTIAILADSTCDLPETIVSNLGINIIPLTINIGENGYLDQVDISRKDFYTNLPHYETHPTTGTPGIDAFLDQFTSLAERGFSEIISIHISESLSATVNIARAAAEQFKSLPVHVIDSKSLSMGTGFQVELASKMAKAGETAKAIFASLDELASRTYVTAVLDSLDYLRRSGRMNRIMTGIGSLLALKPIMTMRNGQPGSEKVRTTQKAENRLIKMLKDEVPLEKFALLHTNANERAMAFKNKVKAIIPPVDIPSVDITPVIGSHIGPGAVGYALVREGGS